MLGKTRKEKQYREYQVTTIFSSCRIFSNTQNQAAG